jgi:hypothetical protein
VSARVRTRVLAILSRSGVSLDEARELPDGELLSLPGFGPGCLAFVRGGEPEPVVATPDGGVAAAVRAELAALERRAPDLAASALAALALALAAEVDDPANSATSKAMCAGSLQKALDRLRELAPPADVADGISGLQERSRLKLAGTA